MKLLKIVSIIILAYVLIGLIFAYSRQDSQSFGRNLIIWPLRMAGEFVVNSLPADDQ